jgi:two-component system, LytTR family, response regulator
MNRLVLNLLNNLEGGDTEKKVSVHYLDRVKLIKLSQLLYFEANGNYTSLHTIENEKLLTARTLKDFEEFLKNCASFIRINKQVIVNLDYITEYSKGEPCLIYLMNGKEFEISRRRKTTIIERLKY